MFNLQSLSKINGAKILYILSHISKTNEKYAYSRMSYRYFHTLSYVGDYKSYKYIGGV